MSVEYKTMYGLMAEFESPTALVTRPAPLAKKGYRKLDAYSPFPIEELTEALHLHQNKLPLIVLIGGILGGLTGYMLQYYVTVIYFPINIEAVRCIAGHRTSSSPSS